MLKSRIFQGLSRLGYASRGIVYLVIGWLTLALAIDGYGRTAGSEEALHIIGYQTFGHAMLVVIAIGFLAFAIWRAVQALADTDDHGTGLRGLAVRGGLLASTFLHLSLAGVAAGIVLDLDLDLRSSDEEYADWSAWALAQPAGRWLLVGAGTVAIAAGLAHFLKAWNKTFLRYIDVAPKHAVWVTLVSRVGLSARGTAFLMIGWFLLVVAYTFDPNIARGLPGAVRSLQDEPYGFWYLLALGGGLLTFGVYSLMEALLRRIHQPF